MSAEHNLDINKSIEKLTNKQKKIWFCLWICFKWAKISFDIIHAVISP